MPRIEEEEEEKLFTLHNMVQCNDFSLRSPSDVLEENFTEKQLEKEKDNSVTDMIPL